MNRFIFIILFMSCILPVNAQIGINTTSPHGSTALHINGNGAKGLLIPFMDHEKRINIGHTAANGLLVYDRDEKMFYFYNDDEWIALNPLQAKDASEGVVSLSKGGSTVTLNDSLTIIKRLTVSENTTLQKPVVVNSTLTANGNINAGNHVIDAGTVHVGSNTEITPDSVKTKAVNATTVNATTVKATTLEGYGVTPVGGIIMWSGITEPDGWVLCTGGSVNVAGSPINGNPIPDLRGRFIAGYSSADTDYNSIGKTGGQKEVTLTGPQMPRHSHFSERTNGDDNTHANYYLSSIRPLESSDGITEPAGTGGRTGYSGGGQAHENRPPYYVLAFIMRVK